MYKALYRKWRPLTFSDVVGQEHVTRTLKSQIVSGRLSHAYLFTGTRGTGKTSCAKILARAVNCEHPQDGDPCNACPSCRGILDGSILDVIEMDAASNNGVDSIRDLRDELIYAPAVTKKRVYIIDEVHMLSTPAFNALLKTLEEPPEHVLFILATTELHKVPATILSRCQKFSFKRILPELVAKRLLYVSEREGIALTQDAAALIARLSDGSMRDALSILDQCAAPGGEIGLDRALALLGLAGAEQTAELVRLLGKRDAKSALSLFTGLYSSGKDVSAVLDELCVLFRDLLMEKIAPAENAALLGGLDLKTLAELGGAFDRERLLYCLDEISRTAGGLSRSQNRRVDAELCLIRLCDESVSNTPSAVNARLDGLERALRAVSSGVSRTAAAAPAPEPEKPARPEPESGGAEFRAHCAPREKPAAEKGVPESGGEDEAGRADFWPELLKRLKPSIGVPEYTHLAPAQAILRGGTLELRLDGEFSCRFLHGRGAEEKIKAEAGKMLGREVRVRITQKTEGPEPAGSKLDEWLGKNGSSRNVIIQDRD